MVKKYIAHDFVAELEHEERRSSTDSLSAGSKCPDAACKSGGAESRVNARKDFSKKLTKDVLKLGDEFFFIYDDDATKTTNEKKRDLIIKILKSIDQGKRDKRKCHQTSKEVVPHMYRPPGRVALVSRGNCECGKFIITGDWCVEKQSGRDAAFDSEESLQ